MTTVEVVSDPAQIKAAREEYKAKDLRVLEQLFVNPQWVTSYEHEFVRVLNKHRDAAIPRLTAVRDNPNASAERRVGAIGALQVVGIEPDPKQLAETAAIDARAEKLLLHRIPNFYPGPGKPVPPVIRHWVMDRIVHPEPEFSNQAVHLATWKRMPGAIERIEEALSVNPESDCRLTLALSELRPSVATTEHLIRLLGCVSEWDVTIILRRLVQIAKECRESSERLRLARIGCECIKRRPYESGAIDDGSLGVISLTGELAPSEGIKLLEALAQATESRLLRRVVLDELAKFNSARATELSAQLGVTATAPCEPASDKTNEMADRQRRAQRAADICVRYGLLTSDQAKKVWDTFEEEEPQGGFTDDPVAALLCFANRFLMFDAETGMIPNRHDELLLAFAQASAGKFRPTAVLENFQPDEPGVSTGSYTVQFVHNRLLYRFHPRDLEDWYDVPSVLNAVNRALDDTKTPDRFINLVPNGQFVRVIFAPPEAVTRIVAELGYDLCPDADEARRQGQAFEERAFSKPA